MGTIFTDTARAIMNPDIYTTVCIIQHRRHPVERKKDQEGTNPVEEKARNGLNGILIGSPIRIREFYRR